MIAPRRFLPSISSLLALEALDRLGTAVRAGQELSLTHSAISRQLKVLEQQLGVSLLERQGQRLQLSPAGRDYAQSIRQCLQDLARASLKLKANPVSDSLNLAILPAFGMHWLAPHLRHFGKDYPDVMINLGTRVAPFDFAREDFDAAIHYGQHDWPDTHHLELARDIVVPVAAPDLLAGRQLTPQTLRQLPLLHLESRPGAWEDWFDRHGSPAHGLTGMLFDQFTTLTEAAVLGFGVALLPDFVANAEIERGRLVSAGFAPVTSAGRYYLVWPKSTQPRQPLLQFLTWLPARIGITAGL